MSETTPIARLAAVLVSWAGTPYLSGSCMRGPRGGVDCVRFVDAVAAEAAGLSLPPLPDEAQDAAWHDPRALVRVERLLVERHACRVLEAGAAQPGALLAVALDGTPFHAALVGPDLRVWHAGRLGVVWTSLQALGTGALRIRRCYLPAAFA